MDNINQVETSSYKELDEFIDSLFETDLNTAIGLIKQKHSLINTVQPTANDQFVLVVLESFWNFFQAQSFAVFKADFESALNSVTIAKQGFNSINLTIFEELSDAFQLYFAAIVDIRNLNIGSGLDKIKLSKAAFSKIDKYGDPFASTIDSIEAESFFIAGVNFFMKLDYENGQIQLNKASNASKKVAVTYYNETSQEYSLFMGLGFFYSAFSDFLIQANKLTIFDFDYFAVSDNQAVEDTLKAINYLTIAYDLSEVANINLKFSKIINLLSVVYFELANIVSFLFDPKKEDLRVNFSALRERIKNARKFSVELGDTGIVFMRFCDTLERQINNIEKKIKEKSINVIKEPLINHSDPAKTLIGNGKTEEAIDYLISNTVNSDFFNDLIIQKARLARLNKQITDAQITGEDARVEETKITLSVLNLIKLQ